MPIEKDSLMLSTHIELFWERLSEKEVRECILKLMTSGFEGNLRKCHCKEGASRVWWIYLFHLLKYIDYRIPRFPLKIGAGPSVLFPDNLIRNSCIHVNTRDLEALKLSYFYDNFRASSFKNIFSYLKNYLLLLKCVARCTKNIGGPWFFWNSITRWKMAFQLNINPIFCYSSNYKTALKVTFHFTGFRSPLILRSIQLWMITHEFFSFIENSRKFANEM